MKQPDEIMAEYLLKGGKMLGSHCSVCGSPLFEYKGNKLCVVCNEKKDSEAIENKFVTPETAEPHESQERTFQASDGLVGEFEETLVLLLRQARNEPDSRRCVELMKAVKECSEAMSIITHL